MSFLSFKDYEFLQIETKKCENVGYNYCYASLFYLFVFIISSLISMKKSEISGDENKEKIIDSNKNEEIKEKEEPLL